MPLRGVSDTNTHSARRGKGERGEGERARARSRGSDRTPRDRERESTTGGERERRRERLGSIKVWGALDDPVCVGASGGACLCESACVWWKRCLPRDTTQVDPRSFFSLFVSFSKPFPRLCRSFPSHQTVSDKVQSLGLPPDSFVDVVFCTSCRHVSHPIDPISNQLLCVVAG